MFSKWKVLGPMLVGSIVMSCGQSNLKLNGQGNKQAGNDSYVSGDNLAANELYLEDLEESASSEEAAETVQDESVKSDVANDRLADMVAMVFARLDSDSSGSLSLEEFLKGPAAHHPENLSDEQKSKIEAKFTEDFNKYAGEDAQLSQDELKTLLKESAPRIGKHRGKHFPGQHEERIKKSWSEITVQYDANKDGLLSQEEFEAMEADKADRRDEMGPPPPPRGKHGKKGGFSPGAEGKGPQE